ncbi:MAG: NifU family protein [Faecalibacterium sp.]|nr:NifU family protein [Ruminococcus sp.]MCM1391452.1 NifU family protein [Ruminococcus sp.]MCM1485233.1 NifU family protein [Faecalibacterium sp.]
MQVQEYVEKVLSPKLQGDGGWIEFVSFEDGTLTVIFRGECSKCLILHRCVAWIEEQTEKDLGIKIKLNGIRKKPYFQDT